MVRTIVITGAASGIGEALALRYAAERVRLGLIDIDQRGLDRITERCRELGAEVHPGAVDVRDREKLAAWLVDLDSASPVDLLIANAGLLCGVPPNEMTEPTEASFELMETNVLGVFNTVHPLLPRMLERGRGHVALMSSVAGFVPLPQMPSYSASKAAVFTYGMGLRAGLRPRGVKVSVICPGYVKTPLATRIVGIKPFLCPVDYAAQRICRGIERNLSVISFPWYFALAMRWGGFLSDAARRYTFSAARFSVTPADARQETRTR